MALVKLSVKPPANDEPPKLLQFDPE